ncbi:MAG: citrate transporter, partial [Clostridia bacterium]|nr:citrate transporter [Clostridia bacterium]
PPSARLVSDIDWHTLATLFMMLTVLEGFKKENIFQPLLKTAGKITTMTALSCFLIFSVFFSSMFVTNDVSLIIFVPITIILFRTADKEKYILPVITMENIAAIRGSLLTPFGSPQNLFVFRQSGVSAISFIRYMFPIWIISGILLILFILFLYRKDLCEKALISPSAFDDGKTHNNRLRILYIVLFLIVITTIVSRTEFWWVSAFVIALTVLIADRKTLIKTDYVLLVTFLCFFVFSSSIAANESISNALSTVVAGREYFSAILLSQVISNVPAAIVLYGFAENKGALIYGLDTAGLCSIIGSLASVINYRIYVREYPQNGKKFLKVFTLISLAFFAFVVIPGYLISNVQ